MQHLGVREWVALGLFAVALGVAFTFLDPAGGSPPAVGTPSYGEIPPTSSATRVPVGTPTPEPTAQRLGAEQLDYWVVTLYSISAQGQHVERGSFQAERLDLSFPGSPAGDLADDRWRASVAYLGTPLPAGKVGFTLEYDCEVVVYLADVVIARGEDGDGVRQLEVVIPDGRDRGQLVIEARDVGGHFTLRVR